MLSFFIFFPSHQKKLATMNHSIGQDSEALPLSKMTYERDNEEGSTTEKEVRRGNKSSGRE